MSGYTVKAVRWSAGWELHIEGVGVTQVKSLAKAEAQARDYIETLTGERDAEIAVSTDLGPLSDAIASALRASRTADRAQRDAAAKKRKVVHDMRQAGLSVSDMATIMDVSRGRISQLIGT